MFKNRGTEEGTAVSCRGKRIWLFPLIATLLLCIFSRGLCADAYVIRYISRKKNTSFARLTPRLQRKIMAATPKEPSRSDLKLIHPGTRISTARLPQGWTCDGDSYYFLSQLSTDSDSLRLTKITYRKNGTYDSAFMTLKHFGHGTNLDCVKVKGTTWLWTGCDSKDKDSTAITCFTFRAGKKLKRHGKYRFRIPLSRKGSGYADNVYAAIDPAGKKLAVRYTRDHKQVFQFYKLIKGKRIRPKKILKKVKRNYTKGVFQGFDIKGTKIYTIEGTAERSEMRERHEKYRKTVIRTYDFKSKKSRKKTVRGAKKISHREPEGIQVMKNGDVLINMTSHYKRKYTCMNIYQVKRMKK